MSHPRILRRLVLRSAAPLLSALLAPSLFAQCEHQELLAPDASAGDRLGHAVASSGSRAVVGAPEADGQGAVYVFRHSGDSWVLEQKLVAFDGSPGDEFGCAVDLANQRLLVGARKHARQGAPTGAAYVYAWNGRNWRLEQRLFAPDGGASDLFGDAVALAGDKAIVGARLDDDQGISSGSAHLFRRIDGTWQHRQKLVAPDGHTGAQFGQSLAAENDLLVVGARHQDQVGAAYVWRMRQGRYQAEATLRPTLPVAGMEYGYDVALAQGRVAVGAPRPHAQESAGAVWLHRFDGVAWQYEDHIQADDLPDGSRFGHAVSLLGNRLAVGAVNQDQSGQGVVHVWLRQNGLWLEEARLVASDGHPGERFGYAVSLSADLLVAGAPLHEHDGIAGGRLDVWQFHDPVAWWQNYGTGWTGTLGVPALRPAALPVLGSRLPIQVGNSRGQATQAAILIGLGPDSRDSGLGGAFLVDWVQLFPFTFAGGADQTFQLDIPCTSALAGMNLYLQALVEDPGASQGIAFSPGLVLGFGQ